MPFVSHQTSVSYVWLPSFTATVCVISFYCQKCESGCRFFFRDFWPTIFSPVKCIYYGGVLVRNSIAKNGSEGQHVM